jgi:hypothetical protein
VAVANGVNLAVRFPLEVAALTAPGYAGWLLGPSAAVSAVLVVVLALAADQAALFAWDQRVH